MMKKLLLLLIVLPLLSSKGWAGKESVEYVWSYGALAETMREMRDHCEPTNGDPFIKIGNWMREKKAKFSPAELLRQCKKSGLKDIDRTLKSTSDVEVPTCQLPNNNCYSAGSVDGKQVYNCGEFQNFSGNTGCDIFFETFKKYNNKRAKNWQDREPGTYVSKVKDGVYQVVDVVLADGYWIRGTTENLKAGGAEIPLAGIQMRYHMNAEDSIDMEVNTDEKNTKIWEITQEGYIEETPYHTWTNDMFLGIATAKDPAGNVTGALTYSFIFTKIDVTKDVYNNLMAVDTGVLELDDYLRESTTLLRKTDSLYDPKIFFPKKYPDLTSQQYYSEYEGKMRDQKETDVHSNGVMFENKVAMLDWLGNLMVGLNFEKIVQRPSIFVHGVSKGAQKKIKELGNGTAHIAQALVDGKQTVSKTVSDAWKLKLWEATKDLASFQVKPEPFKAQQAWDLGEKFFNNNVKVLYDFENYEIPRLGDAENMANNLVIDKFGDVQVYCDASCDRPHVVFCNYNSADGTSGTVLVKFRELCTKQMDVVRR